MQNKNLNIKVSKLELAYIFFALLISFTLIYLGNVGAVDWLKDLTDLAYGDILIIFIIGEIFHGIYFIHTKLFNKS